MTDECKTAIYMMLWITLHAFCLITILRIDDNKLNAYEIFSICYASIIICAICACEICDVDNNESINVNVDNSIKQPTIETTKYYPQIDV